MVTRKRSPNTRKSRKQGRLSVKKETLKDLDARGTVKGGGFVMQDTKLINTGKR